MQSNVLTLHTLTQSFTRFYKYTPNKSPAKTQSFVQDGI